jgi:hypothetical protein
VFFVGDQFFVVNPTSDVFWPTICAKPTPTLELTPDELTMREACPATIETLKFSLGRKFILTSSGLFGLAPPDTWAGDLIVILLVSPVPQVLRKQETGYSLIGECYVHGAMGGEALANLSDVIAQKVPGHRIRPFPKRDHISELDWFKLV